MNSCAAWLSPSTWSGNAIPNKRKTGLHATFILALGSGYG